jgi:uncharacterized repeat protein (TIGR02543 family)
MKNQILRIANLAAIAALVSIGCNDNSVASKDNQGRADDFVSEFNGATYILSVDIAPADGGTVNRNPNKTFYRTGDLVTVTAAAAENYMFTGWSGALNDTATATTVAMKKDLWLKANFIQKSATYYTVTVNMEPDSGGLVTIFPNRTAYIPGDSVIVIATAANGYIFTGWTGAPNAETYIRFTVTSNMSLTANFQKSDVPPNPGAYTLEANADPKNGGNVHIIPQKDAYDDGEIVVVVAEANPEYRFIGWTGALTSANAMEMVKMNGNKTVTATFEQVTYGRGISESRIYVDGVQVYDRNGAAINYNGSFTTFSLSSSEPKITDYFTDPVVNVVNGKLTIDLGEPKILRPVTSFTIRSASDPTANMLVMSEMYNEDDSAMLVPVFSGESVFFYVDKPVTVTTVQNVTLSLRKGWNFVIE